MMPTKPAAESEAVAERGRAKACADPERHSVRADKGLASDLLEGPDARSEEGATPVGTLE